MKKILNYLILFIFIFLIGIGVDAAAVYQEDWFESYNYNDNYSEFWDVISLKNGSIGIGERGYNSGTDYFYGGMLAMYDLDGELVWKVENEENYYLKGTDIGSGFVVLTQRFAENDIGYILLEKYNYDGTKAWEKVIVEEEIEYDLITSLSLDCYKDKIVLSFNNSAYVYDVDGNLLKELVKDDLILPTITIGDDGIYVSGINTNVDTVLEKYNLDTLVKEESKVIYDGASDENGNVTDMTLALDIEYVKGNIVISTYNSSEKSELSIYNDKLELIIKDEVDSIVTEIQRYKNNFITIGREHDNNPKGIDIELLDYINELDEFSFDVKDAKESEIIIFHINIFDSNLEIQWNIILEDFYLYGVDASDNRFVVSGDEYYDYASLMQFVKPILTLDWSNTGNLDEIEYFYDVSYHKNGYIAVGWSTESLPRGIPDAKDKPAYWGKIVSYDKEGKELWHRNFGYVSEVFKVATVDNGFLIFVNDYVNDDVLLIYYSYDGEMIWQERLLDYVVEEYEFDDFKLEGYGNYFAFSFNYFGAVGEILEESNEVKAADDFLNHYDMSGSNGLFDFDMNENGTYLVYGKNGDIVVQKYDVNMNFIEERVIIKESYDAPYDINQYDDKIYLLFDDYVYILKNDLSFYKKIELSYNNYFDIIGTKEGFDILGAVPCVESAPGSHCKNTGFIMNYNMETEKISYVALNYLPYGSDNALGDLVVAGYGYTSEGYNMVAHAEKYSYSKYNVEVATDGNGTITSNKVLSTVGEEVEFTVEPKEGYVLKRVVVTTSSGEVIEFSDYKFTMPSEDVEIYAEFELIPNNPNTGLSNPLVMLSIIVSAAVVGYLVIKKKKFI